MLYCFVQEDLINISEEDALSIQATYAKRLGAYCCCKLRDKEVVDQNNHPLNLKGVQVMLRSTYTNMLEAMDVLECLGAILFETSTDIEAIENWDKLSLSEREIYSVRFEDILNAVYSQKLREFLLRNPQIFIKTRKKRFSAKIRSDQMLQKDASLIALLNKHCTDFATDFMVSELVEIVADSLGQKESRHFVFNGRIVNSSRAIKVLKHTVPNKLLTRADQIVKKISMKRGFPQNYVIDLGEFKKNESTFIDIVELNPITSSLCYCNNSVFLETVEDVRLIQEKLHMGNEFCYDSLENPQRYIHKRYTGVSYAYYPDAHYDLR